MPQTGFKHPTPLRAVPEIGRHGPVFIKDESVLPGGTFKDRLSSGAIAEHPKGAVFASISYGNTARSFALAVEALPNFDFVCFVPVGFRSWELGPSTSGSKITGEQIVAELTSLGASVLEIDLTARFWDDDALRASAQRAGLLDDREFVNVTEGIRRPCYAPIIHEALDQMDVSPAVAIVQFGAGILANEVIDVFAARSPSTVVVPFSTPHPQSIATMLYGPIWINVEQLARAGVAPSRHASPDRTGATRVAYPVFEITDEEIRTGLERAISLGISAEPSGSAGLGFLDRVESIVPGYRPGRDPILVINTGNGIDRVRTMVNV
jgi:threonine dehydratase